MKTTVFVYLFFLLNLTASSARAETLKDPAWEKYISSQKKLQVAMHDLTRLYQPDLKSTLKKSLDLQLALADEKSRKFYFLLGKYPGRIVRDKGFSAFVNFDWTDADEQMMRKGNPEYGKFEKNIKKLRKKFETDPLAGQVQEAPERLKGEQRYREILARFRFVSEEVEKILSGAAKADVNREWQ